MIKNKRCRNGKRCLKSTGVLFFITFFLSLSEVAATHSIRKDGGREEKIAQSLVDDGFEQVRVVELEKEWIVSYQSRHIRSTQESYERVRALLAPFVEGKEVTCVVNRLGVGREVVGGDKRMSRNMALLENAKIYERGYGKIELSLNPYFAFRNQKFHKVYDILLQGGVGMKLSPWKGAELYGEVQFPIYNEYGPKYAEVRPGYCGIIQYFRLGEWMGRGTLGLFSQNRWGVDVGVYRRLDRMNRWGVSMDVGVTGSSYWDQWEWVYGVWDLVTARGALHYYNHRYDVELQGAVERYLAEDYGVEFSMTRYFRHCAIGLFAMHNNVGNVDGGFRFVLNLPSFRRKKTRKINIGGAENWGIDYHAAGLFYNGKRYRTRWDDNFWVNPQITR